MHLFGTRVLKQNEVARPAASHSGRQLRALAAAVLTLSACMPSGLAQQQANDVLGAGQKKPDSSASTLPPAPAPTMTQPMGSIFHTGLRRHECLSISQPRCLLFSRFG